MGTLLHKSVRKPMTTRCGKAARNRIMMGISVFGWFVFFASALLAYIVIDKVILGRYKNKETPAVPPNHLGSLRWLIMSTAIVTLAIAWNPVGLKIGTWISIQFGIMYRDAEAAFQNATSGPPAAQPALVPILVRNWSISPDGLKASFPTPPIGYQWEYRQHGSVGLINPLTDWIIPNGPIPEVFLRSKSDGSYSNPVLLR